jgi:multicomponent Na+:H+ antiporter subunit B
MFIGLGLLFILMSFLPSIFLNYELMTGSWIKIPLPWIGELKLGSPLIFDIGVFFSVIGVTLMFVFSLTKKS